LPSEGIFTALKSVRFDYGFLGKSLVTVASYGAEMMVGRRRTVNPLQTEFLLNNT
jgi:hypothetical protein